jgi:hypothetical protein
MANTLEWLAIPTEQGSKNSATTKLDPEGFKGGGAVAVQAPKGYEAHANQFSIPDAGGGYATLQQTHSKSIAPRTDGQGNPAISRRATVLMRVPIVGTNESLGREFTTNVEAEISFRWPGDVREITPDQISVVLQTLFAHIVGPFDVTTGIPENAVLSHLFYNSTDKVV